MSEPLPQQPFSFDEMPLRPPQAQAAPVEALSRVMAGDELEQIRKSVLAVGEASYRWIIESDAIFWSSNAPDVIGTSGSAITTGRGFASLLDVDNVTSRYDTVMRSKAMDEGQGVPFQIEYLLRPDGRMGKRSLWIEDCGRWYAGSESRPAEVYGVIRRIDDRHRRDQHLSFLGNCDPLTGMMNRGRMAEALGEAIAVAGREEITCAFMIAAINNLAVINDAYGFEVADEVVIAVGRRLRQVMRQGDAIARYSGSKFGFILNHCGEEDLKVAAERFLSAARESVIETERGPVWAMLSIGGIILPKHAGDANTAMARAEEALTEAKRLPSDGYVVYHPSARRVSERGLNARCATEIVSCLKEDRFKLAYQPIIDAATSEVRFHEALLRMADQDGEMIAAAHLIPIAEKLGLVRLIDRSVVQLALGSLLAYPQAKLSFNVSGITATDPHWFGQLTDILSTHLDLTRRLTVEITETVALSDLQHTARFTSILRELGCTVAIDDFGAGFTSFRNLKPLKIDILKLDGSFCRGLGENPDNQYHVRSLIDLARKFDLKTVAEWVETEEDADYLRTWGVDYLQGNLFGPATLDLPWERAEEVFGFLEPAQQDESAPIQDIVTSDSEESPVEAVVVAETNDLAIEPAAESIEQPVSAVAAEEDIAAAEDVAVESPAPIETQELSLPDYQAMQLLPAEPVEQEPEAAATAEAEVYEPAPPPDESIELPSLDLPEFVDESAAPSESPVEDFETVEAEAIAQVEEEEQAHLIADEAPEAVLAAVVEEMPLEAAEAIDEEPAVEFAAIEDEAPADNIPGEEPLPAEFHEDSDPVVAVEEEIVEFEYDFSKLRAAIDALDSVFRKPTGSEVRPTA